MTMKNDSKFEEELTWQSNIRQEEIDKFWPGWAMKNLKTLHFNGLLLNKIYTFWTKKRTEELCLMAMKIGAKSKGKMTCAF